MDIRQRQLNSWLALHGAERLWSHTDDYGSTFEAHRLSNGRFVIVQRHAQEGP